MNKPLTTAEIDAILGIEADNFGKAATKVKLKPVEGRRIDDCLILRYSANYRVGDEKHKGKGRLAVYKERKKSGPADMRFARVITMQWTENTGTDAKQRAKLGM